MEIFDALFTRRSIRQFTGQPVDASLVNEILKTAMYAPSGSNKQSWQFVVITEHEILEAIPAVHPYASMVPQAALAIVVCGDETFEPSEPRWAINCGTASQNILLAVHALGLGAVWCGLYPEYSRQQGIKNLLKLPDHIHPFSLIPIGYPAESPEAGDRFKVERIHYNHW
jgi:nitroreductase